MEDVRIPARDGLELVAYLTRSDTSKATPMVLLVHGGPWARDSWGYNSAAQWFANRGYAVLQVNYRGSSGYSKSFLHKGDKEWGIGSMQHDLTDSVKVSPDPLLYRTIHHPTPAARRSPLSSRHSINLTARAHHPRNSQTLLLHNSSSLPSGLSSKVSPSRTRWLSTEAHTVATRALPASPSRLTYTRAAWILWDRRT